MERNEVALTHAALFEKFLQSKPIVVDKKRFLPIETLREKYKSWIEVSNSVLMKILLTHSVKGNFSQNKTFVSSLGKFKRRTLLAVLHRTFPDAEITTRRATLRVRKNHSLIVLTCLYSLS